MLIKTVFVNFEIDYTGEVDKAALQRALEDALDQFISDNLTGFQYEDHEIEIQ